MPRPTVAATATAMLVFGLAGPGATSTATAEPVDQDHHRDRVGRTVRVTGSAVPTDNTDLRFRVRGGLIGSWTMAPSQTLSGTSYLYVESGRETFSGCVDLNRNTRCEPSEPAGRFHTTYLSWGSFDPSGRLIRGQCEHPLTGGSGRFAGIRGALTLNDRRLGNASHSTYEATVVLDAVPGEMPLPTRHAEAAEGDGLRGVKRPSAGPASAVRTTDSCR